jgi:outer membrane protein with beta-barrel domain
MEGMAVSKRSWICVVLTAPILSAAMWTEGFAQSYFELGFKGGVEIAKLSGSNLEGTEPIAEDLGGGFTGLGEITSGVGDTKTGFVGGLYGTFHVNDRFGIRLEALYAMKGGKGNTTGFIDVYDSSNSYIGTLDISGTNTLTLDYFEVPILGVMSFPTGPSSTFEVFAGPSFGFLSSAKIKEEAVGTFQGESQSQSQTTDLSDNFKGTDVGGVLGAGMSFRFGSRFLFAEGRWTPGFTEIDDTGSGMDWKNNAFGFSAGIGFPLMTTASP